MKPISAWRKLFCLRPFGPDRMLVTMGMGIARRARALDRYWHSHLQSSLAAQRQWIGPLAEREGEAPLLVLGAGRGLDLALEELQQASSRITLVDGDAESRRFFLQMNRRAVSKGDYLLMEISGVIGAWSKLLRSAPADEQWSAMLDRVSQIAVTAPPGASSFLATPQLPLDPALRLVSLNTLSQIPLLWQEIVERELCFRFGSTPVKQREEEWLTAVLPSAQALVTQHLSDLLRASRRILLITDLEYLHYSGVRKFSLGKNEPLPFRINDGEWIATERAVGPSGVTNRKEVSCEVMPALFGIEIEKHIPATCTVKKLNEWEWHIQPLGYEHRNGGTIHRVGAYSISTR